MSKPPTMQQLAARFELLEQDLNSKFVSLEKQHQAEMKTMKDSYEEKLADLSAQISAQITDAITKAIPSIFNAVKDGMADMITSAIKEFSTTMDKNFSNLLEKREKKKNLVLVGLPESDETTDKNRVYELAKAAGIENPEAAIKTSFRDGMIRNQPIGGPTAPRIIKIRFTNKTYREKMLTCPISRYRNLDADFNRIFIRHDMTYDERVIDKNLREELKRRREEEGNPNLVIRNGMIIDKEHWKRNRDQQGNPR